MPKPGHRIQRMNLHFIFGQHLHARDASPIRERFSREKPHIYVPELAVAPGSEERIERQMEKGKVNLKSGHRLRDFLDKEAEIVAEHQVPVRLLAAMVPRLERLANDFDDLALRSLKTFFSDRLSEAIEMHARAIEKSAERDELRENIFVKDLKNFKESLLPKAVKKNPNLRDAEELNVVIRLGTAHKVMVRKLSGDPRINTSSSTTHQQGVTIFLSIEELSQRIRLKRFKIDLSNPQHREMVARSILEQAIIGSFIGEKNFMEHIDVFTAALRIVSKALSFEDIRDICGNWRINPRIVLEAILERKGLKIPDTLESANEIIAHRTLAKRFGFEKN